MVEVLGMEVIRDAAETARRLENETEIAYDSETTGLNPWRDQIATMQFYGKDTGTVAVVQIKDGVIPPVLKELFNNKRTFTVHNGVGFDLLFLDTHGVPWRRAHWYDTLVGETVVVGSNRRDVSVSLRASARRRLGLDIDKDIEHGAWQQELSDRQVEYAAQDVTSLPALRLAQEIRAKDSNQHDALMMEMQLMPFVAEMTANGLPLRADIIRMYREEMVQRAEQAERALYKLFGKPINMNSVPQLKSALAGMGIFVKSTAREVLEEAILVGVEWAPVAQLILDYRFPAQRLKMYNEGWINDHVVMDRVHARFWQCSADTGRFTCSDPNLQQVPKDGRKIVGNVDGTTIVACDYSQIEVRIAAYAARDEKLIERLDSDDIHRAIASDVFEIPPEQVTKEQRKHAKALSFTLLFGGSAGTLYTYARHQGSDIEEAGAVRLRSKFFETYQGLDAWQKYAKRLANSPKPVFIRLPNGLRRMLVGDKKKPTTILNTTVQGTAAIGMKYGMLEAAKDGLFNYIGATVHDELVAAVPDKEAEEYGHCLQEAMVRGMQKVLPITVKAEVKSGRVWQP